MIERLSHVTVYVVNQEEARKFYVNKLDFEVRHDQTMGDFRWLTVGPKGQKDLQIVLMPIQPGPLLKPDAADALRRLVGQGALPGGVFETDDCRATYEKLKARGVEFLNPPEERFYGIEALLKDNSGNWFSMVERPREERSS